MRETIHTPPPWLARDSPTQQGYSRDTAGIHSIAGIHSRDTAGIHSEHSTMVTTLLGLGLAAALLPASLAITCYQCASTDGNACPNGAKEWRQIVL